MHIKSSAQNESAQKVMGEDVLVETAREVAEKLSLRCLLRYY
jgi:hypothetical protein